MNDKPPSPRMAPPEANGNGARSSRLFHMSWTFAFLLLIVNLGGLYGLGNVNALEKSAFLASAAILLFRCPINRLSLFGTSLFVCTVVVLGAATNFAEFSWLRVTMALLGLLSILSFFLTRPNEQDRLLIVRWIALATPAILIYGLLLHFLFGLPILMKDHTGAERLGGATIPAFLAAAAYASSIAAAQLFAISRKPRYLVLVFFCIFICFLSGTRMPSLVSAASSVAILFFCLRSGVSRIALVVIGLTILAGFVFTVGDQLLVRLTSQSNSSRDLLWNSILYWADAYPWRGIGFGHQIVVMPRDVIRVARTVAAHNEYIRLAAELGYPGAAIAVFSLFLAFWGAVVRRGPTDVVLALTVIGLFFLYSYTDNTLSVTYCLFGPLAFAMGSGITASTRGAASSPAKQQPRFWGLRPALMRTLARNVRMG
jgi:O-antigen ligase